MQEIFVQIGEDIVPGLMDTINKVRTIFSAKTVLVNESLNKKTTLHMSLRRRRFPA